MYWRAVVSGLLLGVLPTIARAYDDNDPLLGARHAEPPPPGGPGSGGPGNGGSGACKASPSKEDCVGIKAVSPKCTSQETTHRRDYFYIGGGYVPSGIPDQDFWGDQLYVEKLTPSNGCTRPYPMVFVSAGLPSGTSWLNTPDNRKGWASYYLDQGFQVYIVDIVGNGRSTQNDPTKYGPARFGSTDKINEQGFTAPEKWNFYPQSSLHTQWPGSGTRGDPIFDAFTASIIALSSQSLNIELTIRAAGCDLLKMVGQSYTFCHSAGCTYTALWADECPDMLRASINIEPGNNPFASITPGSTPGAGHSLTRPCGLTNTPLKYDPPVQNCTAITTEETTPDLPEKRSCRLQTGTIHKLTEVSKVPFVMLTGDGSPHAGYDYCFVEFFEQMGNKNYQWVQLADIGIHGNGHFMHLEKNNLEIAAAVERGLKALDGGAAGPAHPPLPVPIK